MYRTFNILISNLKIKIRRFIITKDSEVKVWNPSDKDKETLKEQKGK